MPPIEPVQIDSNPARTAGSGSNGLSNLVSLGQVVPSVTFSSEDGSVQETRAEVPRPLKESSSRVRMQEKFQEEVSKHIAPTDNYEKISVLLIKWRKDLTDMDCEEEVNDLERIFSQKFHYSTDIAELTDDRPELDVDRFIVDFLKKNDGPHNLLIVYYTGHGKWDEAQNQLLFYPSEDDSSGLFVRWGEVERRYLIEMAQSDIFAIMDTCYASNVQYKTATRLTKRYHYFSASGPERGTAIPGPKSFTAALIKALDGLCDEGRPFTTGLLEDRITSLRPKNPPKLADRLKHYHGYIQLAPMSSKSDGDEKSTVSPANAVLTLDIALDAPDGVLSEEQITALAINLPKTLKDSKINTKGIYWADFKLLGLIKIASFVKYAQRWKRKRSRSTLDLMEQPPTKRPKIDTTFAEAERGRDDRGFLTPVSALTSEGSCSPAEL